MKLIQPTKKSNQIHRKHLTACVTSVFFASLFFPFFTLAGPTGGNIVGGAGHIDHAGLNTNIHQHTRRLAVDWDTFNINRDEIVTFEQPDRSSIVLNRIQDINPSQIQGAINANGNVILANPNGVLFGPDASVNVGGLFAAAMSIDSQDFMNGKIDFQALQNTGGLVANEGTLKVLDGGTLALIGQRVRNSGLLIAHFGTVTLAASGRVSVVLDEKYDKVSIGVTPQRLADILELDSPEVLNEGLIQAFGGRVVLTAKQVRDIISVVNPIDESKRATRVIVQNGVTYLTGADGKISDMGGIDISTKEGDPGYITYDSYNILHKGAINADNQNGNAGTVTFNAENTTVLADNSSISAQSANKGKGGKVEVLGNQVGLTDNASIDVSGAKGGGEVLIGGDYQGKNESVKNAEAVYLGESTNIKADAIENGDGGKVIIWSDDRTRAYGNLSATGGEQSGDGGFIETSSKNYADLQTSVDVSASSGQHGEWLIDPSSLTISGNQNSNTSGTPLGPDFTSNSNQSNLNINTLQRALTNGANITIQTSVINNPDLNAEDSTDPNNSYGDITLATDLDFDNAGNARNAENASTLTLRAHRDIIINGRIFDSDGDNVTGPPGNTVFIPDGDILNLTLEADWGGADGTEGIAGLGSVFINRDINLQGGNFSASGVDFIQNIDASTSLITDINTRIPDLDFINNTGFVPDDAFGVTNAPTPEGRVTIIAQNNATLGNITTRTGTGNLSVTATAGSITQDANSTLTIAGTTDLISNGVIDTSNTGNDFTGAVSLTNASTATLNDTNNLTLGNVSNVGTLSTRATGSINQQNTTSINTTGNTASFTAGTDITLEIADNTSTAFELNAANNAILTSTGGINIGTSTIGNDLNITAGGNITDAGVIDVSNRVTFNTGTNAITLNTNTHKFNEIEITAAGAVNINEADNINIAGSMASLNITSGLAGATNTVSNIADSTLNVSGTSTFNLENGGDLILDNFTNSNRNNLQGAITLTNTNGTLNDVRLRNASDISFSALNIGRDLVLNAVGDISQTAAFNVSGDTSLQANNITLLQNNQFAQGVAITDSNVVQLTHSGNLNVVATNTQESATTDLRINTTGRVGIEGSLLNLDINSTDRNIQNTAALTVSNNTTLNAGAGDIDFQTIQVNLENLDITQANRVQINETDNLTITQASVTDEININAVGPVSVNAAANTLIVDSNGAITLSGLLNSLTATTAGNIQNGSTPLIVTNITTLNAGRSDINLTQAANDFNQVSIINARDVTLNDVTLNDATGITLQSINSRDFILTAESDIDQATGTAIVSTGAASINAGNADIILGENNAFTALALTANNATVVNNQALVLNDSTLASSLDLTTQSGSLSINRISAADDIRLTAAEALVNLNGANDNLITDSAQLQASAGIGNNTQINTRVANLEALNTRTGDINITNAGGDITLRSIVNQADDTGNFNFQSSNEVLIGNITLRQDLRQAFFNNNPAESGTGTVNMFTANGGFSGLGSADINNPDIIATNARLIGIQGTLGTLTRPMVLDISGKVEFIMGATLNPQYAPPEPLPADIRDESIIQFVAGDVTNAVNGLTLTEVENLLDISPAIFTELYLFVVSEDAVKLPRDQWYEGGYTIEEDEEYFRQVTGEAKIGN